MKTVPKAHSRPGIRPETVCATIWVKVTPRSSRNKIAGRDGLTYRIRITSPPVDGEANLALIDFLARELRIAKSQIRITSGRASRLKQVLISGLSPEEVSALLD